jgi:hypothetical protein
VGGTQNVKPSPDTVFHEDKSVAGTSALQELATTCALSAGVTG